MGSHLQRSRTHKQRSFPLGRDLCQALDSHPDWFEEPAVIRRQIGVRITDALDGARFCTEWRSASDGLARRVAE